MPINSTSYIKLANFWKNKISKIKQKKHRKAKYLIFVEEIEFIIENTPIKKIIGPHFTSEFYHLLW